MNLYRISQIVNKNYDTYDSAVVAARNENEARRTHPCGDNSDRAWPEPVNGYRSQDWTNTYQEVIVELIGTAKRGTKAGVICASFNAG